MERAIKKVSHGSHQSPQSHFLVPTMEGMALGPLPVRTLASLAAHRPDAQKYTGPSTAEGKAARFFTEQSYRFATVPRRRTGRESLFGEGEALYGCLGAGRTTLGTGRRCEERQARYRTVPGQADPTAAGQGARPKPSVLTIKAGMWFCFKGIVLATPPSIKDSDGGEAQQGPIP